MYPAREVRAALLEARRAGRTIPPGDELHAEVVRRLERWGYLPRDRERVAALEARVTAAARVRIRERAAGPTQLAFPMIGGFVDDGPTQLELVL